MIYPNVKHLKLYKIIFSVKKKRNITMNPTLINYLILMKGFIYRLKA